ncbi:MAG: purine-nucleoside phosphorylase, partial [Anaerolineae bacterium]|nr:purine-nucleoside phosphorylase [Anaerolineae bacterium]
INTLVVTNAAGGLNTGFDAGDIMVIQDHIFPPGMAGYHPLRGPNMRTFGPRFSIHTRSYDPELRKLAHSIAQANGITLRQGVYVSLAGPSFETPAEVRMLRVWGGDTVGMSTAPEVITATHAGMRVLGFSMVTNLSLDDNEAVDEVSHEEVLRMGRENVPRLVTVIKGVLQHMPPYDPAKMENHPES